MAGTESKFRSGQNERNRRYRSRRVGHGLSIVAARSGNHRVRLWAYEPEVRESIAKRRENTQFLPGQPVPENVEVTGDFAEALANARIVISVMPSNHCRRLFKRMLP